MPQRIIYYAEQNVLAEPPKPITLPAATATEIIPSQVGDRGGEIATRFLQNTGANIVFISLGLSGASGIPVCDATTNYHLMLPVNGLPIEIPTRLRVCGYSTAGSSVGVLVIRRRDGGRENSTNVLRTS